MYLRAPSPIAAIARVFDHDEAVIAVLDEAQFRARRIIVWWCETDRQIRMRPSMTSDLGLELNLAVGNANALLEGLGLRPDSVGEIPIETIRARLANPAVRRRAAELDTTSYLERLERLLSTADADDTSRLEWA